MPTGDFPTGPEAILEWELRKAAAAGGGNRFSPLYGATISPAPMPIPFQRLHHDATPPTRAHDGDAGYDLFALPVERTEAQPFATHRVLHPGERRLFRTGIAVAIPRGFYGRIADRSGNALTRGLHVLGGVIDSSYRGDVGVILLNASQVAIWIQPNQRIAQLIIERCIDVSFVESTTPLEQSDREAAGFGSTGC